MVDELYSLEQEQSKRNKKIARLQADGADMAMIKKLTNERNVARRKLHQLVREKQAARKQAALRQLGEQGLFEQNRTAPVPYQID